MKLRLSNGASFSVEFRASNTNEFRSQIRRATLEYFAHEGRNSKAQLQVATDNNIWLSARYPISNAPFFVSFGQANIPQWSMVSRANQRGTWFEYELCGLTHWANRERCREAYLAGYADGRKRP